MPCTQLVGGIKEKDTGSISTGKMSKIKKGLRDSFSRDVSFYHIPIPMEVVLETSNRRKICNVDQSRFGIGSIIQLVQNERNQALTVASM